MNRSTGDDLYLSGYQPELRDDAISIAMSLASMSMASFNPSLRLTTKSESSGSPTSRNNPVAPHEGPIEVDFYRNPTVLSRMILYNKFTNAHKRCRDHPWEASVWVCAKRKSHLVQSSSVYGMFDQGRRGTADNTRKTAKEEYSLRQLPIHIACTSLAFAHDATSRTDLEQLIVRLVVTYPDGCAEYDHNGKLPLHEAIWSNASPETTAMLLMASPHSIDQRDKFGRTPKELNNRRTGINKDEIRDMLNLGAQYWETARQEARLRMKLAVPPSAGDGKSIDSQSVLGTSEIDKESIYTSASLILPPRPKAHPVRVESEEILPMAWEQLERRVILLEQLLAEMYEKNYELAGLVEELRQAKKTLRLELEAVRKGTMHHAYKEKDKGSLSVSVVPEDDEMGSVKLMEQAERIEQLESLVDSYHSKRRKRRNTSGMSDISSISSPTGGTKESAFIRHRNPGREDTSYVSGLTFSEDSYVYEATMRSSNDRSYENQGARWTPPVATTSFLPGSAGHNMPSPMAIEDEEDAACIGDKKPAHKPQATTSKASEIYFPGVSLEAQPSNVKDTPVHSNSMSENSSIVSVENEIHFAAGSKSLGSQDSIIDDEEEEEEEEVTEATMSTRARIEDMVFGSAPIARSNEGDRSDYQPDRYNYDIQIPALNIAKVPSDETREI